MIIRATVFSLLAFFVGFSAFTTTLLVQQSDANKAQQRALVCFTPSGEVSGIMGMVPGGECHRVAIRELK